MIYWLVFIALNFAHLFAYRRLVPAEHGRRWKECPKNAVCHLAWACLVLLPISAFTQWWLLGDWMPPWIHVLGAVLMVAGSALAIWAQRVNPYALPIVRRPQKIITDGPYRLKHPVYIGLGFLATGKFLLLGQDIAIIPLGVYLGILIARTVVEEEMLSIWKNEVSRNSIITVVRAQR